MTPVQFCKHVTPSVSSVFAGWSGVVSAGRLAYYGPSACRPAPHQRRLATPVEALSNRTTGTSAGPTVLRTWDSSWPLLVLRADVDRCGRQRRWREGCCTFRTVEIDQHVLAVLRLNSLQPLNRFSNRRFSRSAQFTAGLPNFAEHADRLRPYPPIVTAAWTVARVHIGVDTALDTIPTLTIRRVRMGVKLITARALPEQERVALFARLVVVGQPSLECR